MELGNYTQKFSKPAKKQTKEQLLAEEIWLYFKKDISFGRIMKMIQLNGDQCIRECFLETQKSDAKEPVAFFLFLVKHNKTIWQ